MKNIRARIIALFCIMGAGLVHAQMPISPYPHLSESEETELSAKDYFFALSAARKVNNSLRVEKELRDDVRGWVELSEVKRGHDTAAVFRHYYAQTKAQGGEILYECEGRGCGQSSVWANDVFGQATLYGKDRNQFYFAAHFRASDGLWMHTVYVVERGNGRLYVYQQYLKLLTLSEKEQANTEFDFSDRGLVKMFVIDAHGQSPSAFNPDLDVIEKILEFAAASPDLGVYVVGHRVSGFASVKEAVAISEQTALVVAELLKRRGITARRVEVSGVGPLVPVKQTKRATDRVEVLFFDEQNPGANSSSH